MKPQTPSFPFASEEEFIEKYAKIILADAYPRYQELKTTLTPEEIERCQDDFFKLQNLNKNKIGLINWIREEAGYMDESHIEGTHRYHRYVESKNRLTEIENAIKDCDVIINCVGNNPVIRNEEDYEEANV